MGNQQRWAASPVRLEEKPKPITDIRCPYCDNPKIVKNGHDASGRQKYHCRSCGRYSRGHPLPSTSEVRREEIRSVPQAYIQDDSIYEPAPQDGPIRQGEIIAGLPQFVVNFLNEQELEVILIEHPYVIVISQDCDLDWDYKARNGQGSNNKLLPNIFFCVVITAKELRGTGGINSGLWKDISNNKNERYQFLQKASPIEDALNMGLPELGVDFKRYFTLPTDEIYFRIEKAVVQRRCRLRSPYLEHFSSRFYYYQSRIALPSDHFSEPSA